MTFARPGFLAFHETENGKPTGVIVFRVTGSIAEAKLSPEDCKALAEYVTH
jgi:hypothetical protein